MLKGLLSMFGLGQSDLVNVFMQTLERLDKSELTSRDQRIGQAQAISAMMDVLRDEDVMASDTLKMLREELDRWVRKGPRRPRE
jgi:hypothetical protein